MIRLLLALRNGSLRRVGSFFLKLALVDIPPQVRIGGGFVLAHRGMGVVIHPRTTIGDRVKIYQQVTVGRSNIWNDDPADDFVGFTIEDDVIICAGAKILTSNCLTVRRGTIVGANAVLTKSTGEYEIWAGVPAVCIGKR